MKNKSKLKKIREKKAGTATVTKEWLYMHRNRNMERGGSIRGGGSGASFHGYRRDCSQFKG